MTTLSAGTIVGASGSGLRPLSVLLIQSKRVRPYWDSFQPGGGPDPWRIPRMLAADHRIECEPLGPYGLPWNPFAGQHQVLEGLDPARAIAVLATRRHADLVLAYFEPAAVALLALRRAVRFRAPIALMEIGLTETWRLRNRMLDFVVPRADAIITLGSNQQSYIQARWRTHADVRFIHQYVDAGFYHPAPDAPDGPVVSVGDDHGRDFATLLAAAEDLPAPLLLKTDMIAKNAEPPSVRVRRGRLPWPEYRDLLQQARFVVVPLHPMHTASGVGTVLEAMACGKALVVSDSPGIRDYVVGEETALLVPPENPAALRAAMERLLRDPALRNRLGTAARGFVERHCSHEAHVPKLAAALRDLAGQRRPAA